MRDLKIPQFMTSVFFMLVVFMAVPVTWFRFLLVGITIIGTMSYLFYCSWRVTGEKLLCCVPVTRAQMLEIEKGNYILREDPVPGQFLPISLFAKQSENLGIDLVNLYFSVPVMPIRAFNVRGVDYKALAIPRSMLQLAVEGEFLENLGQYDGVRVHMWRPREWNCPKQIFMRAVMRVVFLLPIFK